MFKQECIPVGCIPPAAVADRGVSTRQPPGSRRPGADPLWTRHTPWEQAHPCCKTCWDRTPPCYKACWDTTSNACWATTPPPWTEWQRGVKILPCPKLRLRAVIINIDPQVVEIITYYYQKIISFCKVTVTCSLMFNFAATLEWYFDTQLPGAVSMVK